MDQFTINRLGNIRHEEIVAASEYQPNVISRQWKFFNAFALIRRVLPQPQTSKNFKPSANASDC